MGRFYKHIKKAPVSYITPDGVIMKTHLVPINGVNIANSFDIPYVRGIVGLFNVVISRFMFYGTHDENNRERRYPKAQEHIYLPYHQISDMINRCESQSINIKNQLEWLFDLSITRAHEKYGANKFRLSERLIDFLYIFNETQLHDWMEKYNITDSEDRYRIRQLYKFRVVRPSDSNMTREQMQDFYSYMKIKRHKDFGHFVNTNNVSIEARIQKIELHIDLLTPQQLHQLNKIKTFLKEGITKLVNRFHWKLLELQQFITGMLAKERIKVTESNREEDSTHSQVIDRNKTEGEMQKTHEVAAITQKDPEDVPFQDIVQVATYWNIMARGRDMEFMFSLTEKKIQSIITLVKSHGKAKVLNTIRNTGNLLLNSTLTWKSFTSNSVDPDSRFNKIFRFENEHSQLTENERQSKSNKMFKFWTNHSHVSHDMIENLDFTSKVEWKAWFKTNTNNM